MTKTIFEKVNELVTVSVKQSVVTENKQVAQLITRVVADVVGSAQAQKEAGKISKMPTQKALAQTAAENVINELTKYADLSKGIYVYTETQNKGIAPGHTGGYELEYTERLALNALNKSVGSMKNLSIPSIDGEGADEFFNILDAMHSVFMETYYVIRAKLEFNYRSVQLTEAEWDKLTETMNTQLTGKAREYGCKLIDHITSQVSNATENIDGVMYRTKRNYLGELIEKVAVRRRTPANDESSAAEQNTNISKEEETMTKETVVEQAQETVVEQPVADLATIIAQSIATQLAPIASTVNNLAQAIPALQEVITEQAGEIAELQAAKNEVKETPVAPEPEVQPAPVQSATSVADFITQALAAQAAAQAAVQNTNAQPKGEKTMVKETEVKEVELTEEEYKAAVMATKLSDKHEASIASGEISAFKAFAMREVAYKTNKAISSGAVKAHKAVSVTESALLKTNEVVANAAHKVIDGVKFVADKTVTVSATGAHKTIDIVAPATEATVNATVNATRATVEKTKEVIGNTKVRVQSFKDAGKEEGQPQATTQQQEAAPQIVEIAGQKFIIMNGTAIPVQG